MAHLARCHGVFEELGQPGAHGGDALGFLGGEVFFLTDVLGKVVEGEGFSGLSSHGFGLFAFRLGGSFAVGSTAVHDELPVSHAQCGHSGRLHAEDGVMRGRCTLSEHGPDVLAIQCGLLLQGATSKLHQGGIPVHGMHGLLEAFACGDVAGPVGKGAAAHSAFVDAAFEGAQRSVAAGRRAAIVGGENDKRVVALAGGFQCGDDLADGLVHGGEHAGEFLPGTFQLAIGLEVFIRHLER